MITPKQLHSWPGRAVQDAKGKGVGKVKGIFQVDDRNTTDWITVTGAGPFGISLGQRMVPVLGASQDENGIRLGFDRKTISKAPKIDDIETLTMDELTALRDYYGISNEDRGHGAGDRLNGGDSKAEEDAARVERRKAAVKLRRPEDTPTHEGGNPVRIKN